MQFIILKEYQGKGIGRLLVQSVVDDLKKEVKFDAYMGDRRKSSLPIL